MINRPRPCAEFGVVAGNSNSRGIRTAYFVHSEELDVSFGHLISHRLMLSAYAVAAVIISR